MSGTERANIPLRPFGAPPRHWRGKVVDFLDASATGSGAERRGVLPSAQTSLALRLVHQLVFGNPRHHFAEFGIHCFDLEAVVVAPYCLEAGST